MLVQQYNNNSAYFRWSCGSLQL